MRTQFNKGLSFASACIAIILFLLQSCVKTTFNDKNSREIIDEYKSTLYKDSDFIKIFRPIENYQHFHLTLLRNSTNNGIRSCLVMYRMLKLIMI